MTDDVICPVGRFPNGHYFPFLFTLHAHHSPVASSSHLLFLPLPPPAFVPLVNVRDQHQSVIRLLFLSPAHELHTSRGCTPPPHPFDLLQPKEGERARSIQAPGHVKSPQMMSVDGCAFCLPSFAPSLDRLVTVSLLQHVFFFIISSAGNPPSHGRPFSSNVAIYTCTSLPPCEWCVPRVRLSVKAVIATESVGWKGVAQSHTSVVFQVTLAALGGG